ncbi:hypothetical protein VE02_07872 [Pseudogymnoascus sp. 03VT05]|nr:hypothetical protein VE02_07872 [Pseudogymnoascus sp. 03VT05]
MPATFRQILDSRIITFLVGNHVDGKSSEFRVHEEAIAQLSQTLRAVVNKDLVNDPEVWPDVSKGTFERLAQFAYTGDYTVPKPLRRRAVVDVQEAVENEPSSGTLNGYQAAEEADKPLADDAPAEEAPAEEAPPEDDLDGWGNPIFGKKVKKEKKKGQQPWPHHAMAAFEGGFNPAPGPEPTSFAALSYPLLAPRDNHKYGCEPSAKCNPEGDYSAVLLSHAKLWALADIHDIGALKALALYKLHKTLCVFRIKEGNAGDLIHLIRYAYSDYTGGQEGGGQVDDTLKGLVAQYMASNSPALSHDRKFMELLREGGLFVEDFLRLVMQRTQ